MIINNLKNVIQRQPEDAFFNLCVALFSDPDRKYSSPVLPTGTRTINEMMEPVPIPHNNLTPFDLRN